MQRSVRHDHATIGHEFRPVREFEWLARDIGHNPACFDDDEDAARVVPNLLTVVGPRGHAQVDFRLATRDDRVLGLAVHAQRLVRDAEPLGDRRRVVVRAVSGFDRLAEPRVRRIDL